MIDDINKLIKFGSSWLPTKYLLADGWEQTPNQRTEIAAYRDANVYLHRTTSPNHKTSLTLNFCPMCRADKETVQSIISSAFVDEIERKVGITYRNEETNSYESGVFYIPDIRYKTLGWFGGECWYSSFSCELVEY